MLFVVFFIFLVVWVVEGVVMGGIDVIFVFIVVVNWDIRYLNIVFKLECSFFCFVNKILYFVLLFYIYNGIKKNIVICYLRIINIE